MSSRRKSSLNKRNNNNRNTSKITSRKPKWEDVLEVLRDVQVPKCGICNQRQDKQLLSLHRKRKNHCLNIGSDNESDHESNDSDDNELLCLPPCACELRFIDVRKISKANKKLIKEVLMHKIKKDSEDDEKVKHVLTSTNILYNPSTNKNNIRIYNNSILCRKCLSEMVRVSSDVIEVDYNDVHTGTQNKFTVEPKCIHCKTRYTPRKITSVLHKKNYNTVEWDECLEYTYMLCYIKKYFERIYDKKAKEPNHVIAPEKGEVLGNLLKRDPKFRQEYEDSKFIKRMLASQSGKVHLGLIDDSGDDKACKNNEEEDRKYAEKLQNEFRMIAQQERAMANSNTTQGGVPVVLAVAQPQQQIFTPILQQSAAQTVTIPILVESNPIVATAPAPAIFYTNAPSNIPTIPILLPSYQQQQQSPLSNNHYSTISTQRQQVMIPHIRPPPMAKKQDDDNPSTSSSSSKKRKGFTMHVKKSKKTKEKHDPIQQLLSMGFNEKDAILSYDNAKGDLNLAISMLISSNGD